MKAAQKKHKEHHDAGLQSALEQHETTIQESDDPKVAKRGCCGGGVSNSKTLYIRSHMQGSNMQLNKTPEEAYNELMCISETIIAILFEMRMDLRFRGTTGC